MLLSTFCAAVCLGLRALQPLAACQIHKVHFGAQIVVHRPVSLPVLIMLS